MNNFCQALGSQKYYFPHHIVLSWSLGGQGDILTGDRVHRADSLRYGSVLRADSPVYNFVSGATSPCYLFVDRAASPRYISMLRADSPRYGSVLSTWFDFVIMDDNFYIKSCGDLSNQSDYGF